MLKYTYLILNTRYDEPVAVYVRFPEKLTKPQYDAFQGILKGIKAEYINDEECTTYDIVYNALLRFERDYYICGVIVDGHYGQISF